MYFRLINNYQPSLIYNSGTESIYAQVAGKIVEVNCLAALSWTNHVVVCDCAACTRALHRVQRDVTDT